MAPFAKAGSGVVRAGLWASQRRAPEPGGERLRGKNDAEPCPELARAERIRTPRSCPVRHIQANLLYGHYCPIFSRKPERRRAAMSSAEAVNPKKLQ